MGSSFLHVEQLTGAAVSELGIEVVERKGQGHPDTLIDGACESVSKALCDFYQSRFGKILHYNVDKGLLVGGRSNPRFGGGEVVDPIYMVVAGRAISYVVKDGYVEQLPVGGLAVHAIKKYLKSMMRYLDTENHVIVDYKIKQGSADLVSIFKEKSGTPLSNDTSIGVGFAPLSPTERLVLEVERLLNSEKLKKELPELGEDIKVMAMRREKQLFLTIAVATISHLVRDASHYLSVLEQARRQAEDLAAKITSLDVTVMVNSGDLYKKDSYYLTVTGTSAESGDDGNTGRGNRPNGLITPMRQYSMEAVAGKNPVNHTGKIFNVLAQRSADRIYEEVKGVREIYVRLLSRIGEPINQPQIASAGVVLEKDISLPSVRGDIEEIMSNELVNIGNITKLILCGSVTLF